MYTNIYVGGLGDSIENFEIVQNYTKPGSTKDGLDCSRTTCDIWCTVSYSYSIALYFCTISLSVCIRVIFVCVCCHRQDTMSVHSELFTLKNDRKWKSPGCLKNIELSFPGVLVLPSIGHWSNLSCSAVALLFVLYLVLLLKLVVVHHVALGWP